MRCKVSQLFVCSILAVSLFTACGTDPKVKQLKNDIDIFCTDISELDTKMNAIDAASDNAGKTLLNYLDQLNEKFQEFATLDFPKEYDYLEATADEAAAYMTEAVSYYHKAYPSDDIYEEAYADYAAENYTRAWKRIRIIFSLLRGEEPENVELQ